MTGFSDHRQNMNILQASTNTQDRNIIILRKPNILPQKDEILLTNTSKKRPRADKTNKHSNQKPPPLAVARRNARERNRVKQVNNGFATLRQHIPNSIAAAFESSSGRGGNKKLSKVETLRMAVEYIRNLEDILAADGYEFPNTSNASPNQSFNFQVTSPLSMDDDDLSTNPTPPPQQYIKINNTYQLISNIYDDPAISIDENILSDQIINENMVFGDLTLLNSINTNASLSPEVYSDNSLSPTSIDKGERYVYKAEDVKVKVEDTLEMVHEEHKENMMHVMAWWEQQQQHTS